MSNSAVNFTTSELFTCTTELVEIVNMCVHSFSFLVGCPTHFYVAWLIMRGAGSGLALEFFILNLSIAEIGFSVNSLTFVLSDCFSFMTGFKIFLLGLTISGRPLFQCLICVERYLAVVHPVIFLKYKPLRYRVICCTVSWILILGSCLCCMFTVILHNVVHLWFLAVQFLIFFFIQLFCLVAVLRALKQSGPGEKGRERGEENHMKRRAFYLILITTGTMLITYAPYCMAGFISIVTKKVTSAHWVPCLVFYVLAGFVQPVLYLQRAGRFSCLF